MINRSAHVFEKKLIEMIYDHGNLGCHYIVHRFEQKCSSVYTHGTREREHHVNKKERVAEIMYISLPFPHGRKYSKK